MFRGSPQDEIFLLCMNTAIDLFEPDYPDEDRRILYDHLPGIEAPYPFIFIGEAFETAGHIKMARSGQVLQTIHAYGTPYHRSEISEMLESMRNALYKKKRTTHFYVDVQQDAIQMAWDQPQPNGEALIHGILEVRFNYC